jgi:hypothetical protein
VGLFERAAMEDADTGKHLNFLMVDVKADKIAAYPVLMKDLKKLYNHMADGTKVNILDRDLSINSETVNDYIKAPVEF